jgi:hypothetical protein
MNAALKSRFDCSAMISFCMSSSSRITPGLTAGLAAASAMIARTFFASFGACAIATAVPARLRRGAGFLGGCGSFPFWMAACGFFGVTSFIGRCVCTLLSFFMSG